MNIGWPEGIYLALMMLSFGYRIRDGQPEGCGKLLFWLFVILPLLWWGGFFA